IPKDNEKDLAEVPANVLKNLEIILVENVDEVLKAALLPAEGEGERVERVEQGGDAMAPAADSADGIPLPSQASFHER
ncbi:MAG: S16 family serine protease, partial [Bacteroidota bacterium]